MSSIMIVGVLPSSLINFRGELIRAVVERGSYVVALSEAAEQEVVESLNGMGVKHIAYPVQRNGISLRQDFLTFLALRRIIKKERPDVILAYTIKPVVWGGLASWASKKSTFHALVTGLGYAFQEGGYKRRMLNIIVTGLYRLSLIRAKSVIFQNPDNRDVFVKKGIVSIEKCSLVNGSGVDIDHFQATPLPNGNLAFVCIARLLGEKGLREYAAAAQIVKQKHPDVIFRLVGPEDPSPDGIPIHEVEQWVQAGFIEYCGATKDVRSFISSCHVYVLPSYHEGLPRTVIEAMAMGRAIITTDVPGCRETVIHESNGYLVPDRDPEALAVAMLNFIDDPQNIERMGLRSRELAEKKYDVHQVNEFMIKEMGI